MLVSLVALMILSAPDPGVTVPRMGLAVLDCPEEIDQALLVEVVEECISESGRFEPLALPDSSMSMTGNIIPIIQAIASDNDLDFVCALTVRPVEDMDRVIIRSDSALEGRRTTVSVSARFYDSSGGLVGTAEESSWADLEPPLTPDLDRMAAEAAVRLCSRFLVQVFPVEVQFTAAHGSLQDLPAGRSDGLRDGMFLSAVASATEIPSDPGDYDQLRSRGLMQVVDCDERTARVRMLAGRLAPGGPVTAVEQGAPALLRAGWAGFPADLEEGAEQGAFSGSGMLNCVRLGIDTYRWGFCFGGSLLAGTMENLSSVGVELRAGPRIPLAAPGLALRLTAGGMVEFMVQEVAVEYLATDASSVLLGGILEGAIEYLPSSHIGITASTGAFAGSRAGSWTVQEQSGEAREALDEELYFSEVGLGPLWFNAGLYYLIY